ncbi:MAG: sulfite exporter TauE/SafE family protein [Acidobacteria bacterium]|nr:sulfite exporter TauE/SafE family protein [Acidobacteriota bacterium]
MTPGQIAALVASSTAAGVMNAMAGGGTILTYPTLLWLGESPIIANATSTVALLPGAASSLFGYRREVAVLGFLGVADIHASNGLKNFFGMCINGVAAAYFILRGAVEWRAALVMMAGAILGGYAGARFARKIGQARARAAVIVIGFVIAGILLYQSFGR